MTKSGFLIKMNNITIRENDLGGCRVKDDSVMLGQDHRDAQEVDKEVGYIKNIVQGASE